ncbi:MAG: trigger factor [Archangium sp.]|nr:trigger factor [Archangium sp.]
MKVQVEDVSPIEKRLSIEVEPAVVEQALTQAFVELGRQVKLPGFRPGKIPRRILEQRFGTEVHADVMRRVQLNAFVDAAQEHKVDAVGEPHLSGGTFVANQPYAFTARVEVKPVLTAKDYRGLQLTKHDAAVAEEKVTEQIDRLRQSRAVVEEVNGRTVAQTGDVATVDFDATIDGQPFPGSTARDAVVDVAAGQFIEGNVSQLAGIAIGASTEFDTTFPADYRVDAVKGKTAKIKITLKALKAKKVPALDDAFAVTLGLTTVAELKSKVRTDLERAAKATAWRDEREGVFKALIEKNPFELPKSMLARAVDAMLESALRNLSRQGIDPRMLNLNWDSLRDEMRPKAELDLRGQLLLEAIAKHEKLEASDEDVLAQMQDMADDAGVPLAAVQKQVRDAESLNALRSRAVEQKAVNLITQHAKY